MSTNTATDIRTHQIDKAHSEVGFVVRHLVSKVRGRFSDFGGTITFDEAHPEHSSVSLTVQTASIDTTQADRDTHLRSNDFFAVEQFPTLTFQSTAVTARGDNQYDVAGELTIRGVSKPVVLKAEYLGQAKDPWGNEKIGFEGELAINRKDFGLTWNATLETGGFLVGDEVRIHVAVQAA
jgi:polyisoprenoid-binding protein YceI